MVALGLGCLTRAFSSCSEQGLLLVAGHGFLTVVASLVVEHGLQGTRASAVAAHGLQNKGLVVVTQGLSCSRACGILVSGPGIKLHVPCFGRWILIHWAAREVLGSEVLRMELLCLYIEDSCLGHGWRSCLVVLQNKSPPMSSRRSRPESQGFRLRRMG